MRLFYLPLLLSPLPKRAISRGRRIEGLKKLTDGGAFFFPVVE